ncbi:recombinase family protein [Kribbella deserti]|uniref:Recombinase family protein n=1 Tax=Kribbella deserti TaxID=1926257 RepID=A0ABV6QGL7_9ACTN
MGAAGSRLNVDHKNQEESLVMGEVIELRPLVLGYARLAPFASHSQHTTVQKRLSSYAHRQGLQLGTIYFERTGSAPHFEHSDEAPAFNDLVAAINRTRATGVVVPSLDHFGEHKDKRVAELEDAVGVVVYTVDVYDLRD